MKVVTAEEMRRIDCLAIEKMGIPGVVLMENAGRGVVSVMEEELGELEGLSVEIVCGKGNNGGDGFVVARFLANRGCGVEVYLLGRKADVKGDAKVNLNLAIKAAIDVREVRSGASLAKLEEGLRRADIVVDAVFGTGFKGAARGIPRKAIELINAFDGPVFSIDVPSGLDSTKGQVEGPCVVADVTATMCLPKTGLLLYPGRIHAGDVYVIDIGVPDSAAEKEGIALELLDRDFVKRALPVRAPFAHKGGFGHLLVVAGSPGMTGAAALASMSALRVGCGLVTLAVPASLNDIMEIKLTEVMTLPVPQTPSRTFGPESVEPIASFLANVDALAVGPGLSASEDTEEFMRRLLPLVKCPTVIDADGLNALSRDATVLRKARAPLVLTPHPGEASRLIGAEASVIDALRIDYCVRLSKSFASTVVLKGAPTVVACSDGSLGLNPTGNSGMATGGSGDVLTGMIGGFLAQGVESYDSAAASVYLHGLAGDLGALEKSEYCLVAGDILDYIPMAFRECMEDLTSISPTVGATDK
jgi:NAD(P)H-hydrate epimerase